VCPNFPTSDLSSLGGAKATDSIAVAFALNYFPRFQPKNRLSSPKTI
jgi:hypothetical protein